MCGVLNINSFNKKFIIALVGGFIRLILFNSMYFFTNTRVATFGMVLLTANINFSISCAFALGCELSQNLRFYKVSCILFASVMTGLLKFFSESLINAGGRLRSENFDGMLTCFLSSMACTSCFGQREVTFSKKPFTKEIISGTTYNHILD